MPPLPAPGVKIAFIGACCAGKTSLLRACQSHLAPGTSLAVVEEAARAFFQLHPQCDRCSAQTQGLIQFQVLANEQAAHRSGAGLIVCDRSVIDSPAYAWAYGDRPGALALYERVRPWLSSYTRLFLLDPSDVPYCQDDVRQEDEATRQRLHGAFQELLSAAGIDHELLSGTMGERLDRVLEMASLHGHFLCRSHHSEGPT